MPGTTNAAAAQKRRRLDPSKVRVDSHTLAIVAGAFKLWDIRTDAAETAAFARQLEYIKTRTYDKLYPQHKARKLIPVSSEVPEGAQSYTWRAWDYAGMAKIIANYADDLPRVEVMAEEKTQTIAGLGTSYAYSTQDLRSASMGVPLDSKRADAARLAHENKIEQLAAFGDANTGLPGFANNTNVPLIDTTDLVGGWGTATAAQMYSDLSIVYASVRLASKGIFECDTIVFPLVSYNHISEKVFSELTGKTVLQQWLENHPGVSVEVWPWLDLADSGGDGPRGIAYKKDPMVVELVIPMEMRQLPPQAQNLAFTVPCEGRYGGVCVYYPLGMVYFEDI